MSSLTSQHTFSLISDIPFKYPLTDREGGVQEGGGMAGKTGGWKWRMEALGYSFLLVMDCRQSKAVYLRLSFLLSD